MIFFPGGPWIMSKKKEGLKKKIVHEMVEYWINVAYLTLAFAAFTQYRRLVLAAYDITYTHYWVAVIEALVLAKVIMVGDIMRLGRRLEHKPLIYSTLLKTVVFSIFVGAFTVIEHVVRSLIKGEGLTGGLLGLIGKGHHELLAGCLVTFVVFIPFFAFRELGRVLGEGKIRDLFFRKRTDV
jgi:cytochrome bd-type quinol oxidase subunit 2